MPPKKTEPEKSIDQIVEEVGLYPMEAYEFVQLGLSFTVEKIHGTVVDPAANRHVSVKQLCEGLRDLALQQWGRLSRIVLNRWNINSTEDFGRIIFAMVDSGWMQKTPNDTLLESRNVFDFSHAFEESYIIESLQFESPK